MRRGKFRDARGFVVRSTYLEVVWSDVWIDCSSIYSSTHLHHMWSMPSCCLSRKKLRNVRRPAPAGSASTPKVVVLDLIKAAKSYVATPDFDSPVHVNLHQTKVYRTRVRYLVLQNWHLFFVFRVGILLLFDHFGAGKMISTSGAECMEATRKIARQCTYFVTVGPGTGTEKREVPDLPGRLALASPSNCRG